MEEQALELSACRVDLARGWVERGEQRLQLSSRELALLRHLSEHAGRVVTRDELLSHVWGYSDAVVSRACDNSIYRLRSKIEQDASCPEHLLTVYGEGYRFVPHLAPAPAPAPPPARGPSWSLGERIVELGRRRVVGPEGEETLTEQEASLLQHLHAAGGAPVDVSTLIREIWGTHTQPRAVNSAIRRLRQKIEPDPSEPRYLLTERGGGFRLVLPAPTAPEVPRDALVGRASELEALRTALQGSRWVLVTGPGGIGKTRLLRQLVGARPGPLWWADLAQADTADEALQVVARALSVELKSDPVAQLGQALSRRQGLLVLDNLEQVAEALAPLVRSWLGLAPGLVLVGTSRVRLGLPGEVVLELPPLSLDDATELFFARARAAHPSLRLRAEQQALVRTLTQRLDGLPLAIELAAARVGTLGLQTLLERLDRRLDVLALPRAEGERHRSLRAVLADTWELLDPAESEALLLLSRFREGFSVEDAEGLLDSHGLDPLQALRDHSLVHPREDERFGVYESIRLFADEQRQALPDQGRDLDLRWVRWMARLGQPELLRTLWTGAREIQARGQRAAAEDLERATDVALAWDEPELAAQALLGAAAVRQRHGPYGRLLEKLDRLLVQPLSPTSQARLVLEQAMLLYLVDRDQESQLAAARAAALGEALASAEGAEVQARALYLLGYENQQAEPLERSAALYAALGRTEMAQYTSAQALSRRGDGPGSLARFEEVMKASRRVGDLEMAARATYWVARYDEVNGRLELASRRYREALELFQRVQLPAMGMAAGNRLMLLGAVTGDTAALEPLRQQVLALAEQTGSPLGERQCWLHTAHAHTLADRLDEAREAIGRARQAMICEPLQYSGGHLDLREAELMRAQEDLGSALALAESARARFVRLDDRWGLAQAEGLTACLLAERGQLEEALAMASRAVAELEPHPADVQAPIALLRRGQVRARAGDRAGAEQDLARGEQIARAAGFVRPRSAPGVEAARLRALLAG